jgi:demethylmenaquinone methyltransferase/2-methoxy-6-polyprenyl-1,4-benzoquinol methylase
MSQNHMLDYYAARAAEYDRVYLKPERQADLRQIEAWLPVRFAGRSVLEVACGTGHWTRLIAPVAA